MEQLKSHLRAGTGTNVSFISHIHVHFLYSVISVIVLPMLPSPSSAVLLKIQVIVNKLHRNKVVGIKVVGRWSVGGR